MEASKILAALVPLIAGLFALVATVTAALLTIWAMLKSNRRTTLAGIVTTERAQWRQDLRANVSELVASMHDWLAAPSADRKEFERLRVAIRLRLNPDGGPNHPLDQAIEEILDDLARLRRGAAPARDRDWLFDSLDDLERNVQRLLKQEWTKSKREALTGEMEDARRVLSRTRAAAVPVRTAGRAQEPGPIDG